MKQKRRKKREEKFCLSNLPADPAKGLDVKINRLRREHPAGELCDSESSAPTEGLGSKTM